MDSLPIYMDYMATTPIDPRVVEVMLEYMGPEGCYANPASTSHLYGKKAAEAIEKGRQTIANTLNVNAQDIIFTSGATEADNLAILGAARFYQNKGKHLITLSTEHKAVLDSFAQLEKEGFTVTYLQPESDGLLQLSHLEKALRPDTILVSIMQVNNEIGVIQDIAAIGQLLHKKGIIFHVDAAQSAGKLAIDLQQMHVDLMSLSAHKNYGPKGIGALYVRQKPRIRLQALTFGGGHEKGLRSGTLATHQIMGMAKAFALANADRENEQSRILALRTQLWSGIKHLKGVRLNGNERQRVAGNLNVCFAGLDGDSLLYALKDLAITKAAACSSSSEQPSYVLKALGLSDDLANSSLRFSLGRYTTADQVKHAIHIITTQVQRLHEMSPL